jgi:CheY-like chemotaxis protein
MEDKSNQAYDYDIDSHIFLSDDPLVEINDLTLQTVFVSVNQIEIENGGFEENRNILIIENDHDIARDYGLMLTACRFNVSYAYSPDEALKIVYYQGKCFSFIIIDIRMEHGEFFTSQETSNSQCTGAILCREVLEYAPDAKIVALTNSKSANVEALFKDNVNHRFCSKLDYPPDIFCKFIGLLNSYGEDTIDNIEDNSDFAVKLETILKSKNISAINIEELVVGDKYEANQVGAQGPNAHVHDNTFNQVWDQSSGEIDLPNLAKELEALRIELSKSASSADDYSEIGSIANAETEAKNGDGSKALEYLSKSSKWTLDVAQKIGVGVALAAIKVSLGI